MIDTPILDKLATSNIMLFGIDETAIGRGTVYITEACDYYHDCVLTKDEVYKLAEEIKAIGDLL